MGSLDDWNSVDNLSISVKSSSLTIASFNVLYDVYEKDKIKTENVYRQFLKNYVNSNADIIAIVQVTPDFIKFFQELEQKCGNIEADIIGLVIQLEQIGIFVRPWTGISKIQNTAIVTLALNPSSDYDLISIETRFARVFIAIWS